jgi:hypothetical protein
MTTGNIFVNLKLSKNKKNLTISRSAKQVMIEKKSYNFFPLGKNLT